MADPDGHTWGVALSPGADDVLITTRCVVQDDAETLRRENETARVGATATAALVLPASRHRDLTRKLEGRRDVLVRYRRRGDDAFTVAAVTRVARYDGFVYVAATS